MNLKSILLLFLTGCSVMLSAQNISVADFQLRPTDMTAASKGGKRIDQNGQPAALIRIETTERGFVFEAGALGIVDSKQETGEVWVWVPRASRKITIKHPQLGVLYDYMYPIEIEAERTYWMKLVTAKVITTIEEGVSQQYLTFQVTPPNATLEVNDQLWTLDADGIATKYVDFGEYTYRVRANDYYPDAGRVTVDDPDNTKVIAVTLKSNLATVTLKVDADAEIWVNNERKGVRSWTGPLGSGTYRMECKQDGHETSVTAKEITAEMNGQTITLAAPKPIYGSLNVESSPQMATLYIDGNEVGKTPKSINEIMVGQHTVRLVKEGHNDYLETITITKGERKQLNAMLNKKTKDVQQPTITQPLLANSSGTEMSELTLNVNGVSFTMKPVEGGTFWMGYNESDKYYDKPSHLVTLSSYYMAETEVTQQLWEAVTGKSIKEQIKQYQGEAVGTGKNFPVYYVSWDECQDFIKKLNQLTGRQFRLPTEAEWEFAARGGNKSKGYIYSGSNKIEEVAWYNDQDISSFRRPRVHAVKKKHPNELGIYDMSGNVEEYCQDWYGDYCSAHLLNPTGLEKSHGYYYSTRGGSRRFAFGQPARCRVSSRNENDPQAVNSFGDKYQYNGFRLAMSASNEVLSMVNDWDETAKRATTKNYGKELEGALPGKFSVSATEQVYFSQGNLQYQVATNIWRFAEQQWLFYGDRIEHNHYYSTYGWVDMFPWGTSGWDCGNRCYHPLDSLKIDSLYGPPGKMSLTGDYANSDWGVYNAISNGGNTPGIWRTLTDQEWKYLFKERSTISGLHYAKAIVSGVHGLVLLPDNWDPKTFNLRKADEQKVDYKSNIITASDWGRMEQAGAVFLPAIGYFWNSCYWSASYDGFYGKNSAMSVFFDYQNLFFSAGSSRSTCCFVRLVRTVKK